MYFLCMLCRKFDNQNWMFVCCVEFLRVFGQFSSKMARGKFAIFITFLIHIHVCMFCMLCRRFDQN